VVAVNSPTGPDPGFQDNVTPIVVTYNSAHCISDLADCLSGYPHVIVSDNASGDATVQRVRDLLPQAEVLTHDRNLGFGAANNRALARVNTHFALLLNPDCAIRPEDVSRLVEAAQSFPEASILGPQIRDGKGRPEVNYRWAANRWKSKGPAAEGPACVGFLSGAVMLLRMDVCAPLGFFDEAFFLYYEDDDLCLKMFDAKRPLIIVPAASAVHLARRSVKGKSPLRGEFWRGYHHAQSKLTYRAKHLGSKEAARLWRQLMIETTLALPLRIALFSPRMIARLFGRWRGVASWKPQIEANARQPRV